MRDLLALPIVLALAIAPAPLMAQLSGGAEQEGQNGENGGQETDDQGVPCYLQSPAGAATTSGTTTGESGPECETDENDPRGQAELCETLDNALTVVECNTPPLGSDENGEPEQDQGSQ